MAKKTKISQADVYLWRKFTNEVQPLAKDMRIETEVYQAETADIETNHETVNKSTLGKDKQSLNVPRKPNAYKADLVPGVNIGLDKRTAQKLRRGQLRPQKYLDLHGMTQFEAHEALNEFIFECYENGLRNVLVITGKGSVTEGGILRRMLPKWLNSSSIRDMIIAIEVAIPRDGGTGAYYVIIRRKR